ncbi:hypothetical protein L483_29525 [Pseudomonas putida H8234]|nr:hypothetical protein L483_29525 [Pseudomonas putida H8234]
MEAFQSGYEHLNNCSEVRVLIKCAIESGLILFFQVDQCSLDLSAHAEIDTRRVKSGYSICGTWV